MRKIFVLVMIVVGALVFGAMVSGCGTLKGVPLPTKRNLTAQEVEVLSKQADDFFIFPLPGVVWVQNMLVEEYPGLRIAKAVGVLNTIPFIGPGWSKGAIAEFYPDGTLSKTARTWSLKPFISRMRVKEFGDGEGKTVLSSTRVFGFIGGGKLEGKRFFTLFVPIGVSRADIKEACPAPVKIEKHLGT